LFYDWVFKGLRKGVVSTAYPYNEQELPNYRGLPAVGPGSCPDGCRECEQACLPGAVQVRDATPVIDTALCLFCGECQSVCPRGRITLTNAFETAITSRQTTAAKVVPRDGRLFAKSLYIRHVDAACCGACLRETASLNNPFYDVSRLGIFFTASPRHADVLLVTGPVSWGMRDPLREAYEAMPGPKFVVAAGACAAGGGPFGQPATVGGVDVVMPVDVYIPGCPPHPLALIDGLRLLGGRARKEV